MLQNKVQMQQQTILMKQTQIKEMEAPSKAATEQASVGGIKDNPPRFDEYVKNDKVVSGAGIYCMEKEAGLTEQLKITEQMRWVGLINTVKAQVEENIFVELIYA